MMRIHHWFKFIVAGILLAQVGTHAVAQDYLIQASDILQISVWKEPDLQAEVIVRPDGKFSFPLAGEVVARSKTVEDVRADIVTKIEKFIPDPVVTVSLLQSLGNRVFVIGKVNRPGDFPLTQDLDVLQALALGGGLATFADSSEIRVLRRNEGATTAAIFNYDEIERGENLEQNILLQSGDVVIVP